MRTLILAAVAAIALSGCATLEKHESTARLVTQYAVLKYAEQMPAEKRAERVERIRNIATDAKALAQGETTLALLQSAVSAAIDKAGLSPADRVLADGLVQILVAELQGRISAGVLSPDELVQVVAVLDWVIQATQLA